MTSAALPAPLLARGLWLFGLGALALITLTHPASTRMYAWPWSVALGTSIVAPALILMHGAFSSRAPLVLPPPIWRWLALGIAAAMLGSALMSPHRGESLLCCAVLLAPLAWFFAFYDWLHRGDPAVKGRRLLTLLMLGLGVIATVSLVHWIHITTVYGLQRSLLGRNAYPLGHANYVAGLAVLLLPLAFGVAWQGDRLSRSLGFGAALVAIGDIFTAGSRAGIGVALLLLAIVGLALTRTWRQRVLAIVALLAVSLAVVALNPRVRAMLLPARAVNLEQSNLQRAAMSAAGLHMGSDRALIGWGPGTTPLVFPRYRASLPGGAENVLQLHSTPIQLWAELGTLGLVVAFALGTLVVLHWHRAPIAGCVFLGYGIFSLTDWQLDVPIFGFTLAACTALLVPSVTRPAGPRDRHILGAVTLLALALVTLLGRRDSAPELNVRALSLAPTQPTEAIRLLRESLRINQHQELPHTNLGWLLVVSDPAEAARHFRASARLVPDKGGIYFGLGLAALNQGNTAQAARAFALECLNDPAFLASPYWREPAIAATREQAATAFAELCRRAGSQVPINSHAATTLARLASRADDLGRVPEGPERAYRRERTGYPVLTRQPDLPAPLDLFVVREIAAAPPADLPPKGWLPSPLLLTLLDTYVSVTP